MKYSHQVLVIGTALIIIGLVLGFNHMPGLVEIGLLSWGLGFGVLSTLGYILRLEKKLSQAS
jgi:small-conductance mechanosensitive channel